MEVSNTLNYEILHVVIPDVPFVIPVPNAFGRNPGVSRTIIFTLNHFYSVIATDLRLYTVIASFVIKAKQSLVQ